MPTFAEYLEKWLKQSTAQGLTNPLVKMPVKRFRPLQPDEFNTLANGGTLIIGTMADPISRNLHKNYQTRIRERGEHCAFVCSGSVEMIIAGATDGTQRKQLFPVCLKRASFQTSGDKIKVVVAEDEAWQFNPVLQTHLRALAIPPVPTSVADNPIQATDWVKTQLGNRASQVTSDSYVGLFSSQQMVVQNRLSDPPLKQALAKNPVVQAKIAGGKIEAVDLGEITDDGLEELESLQELREWAASVGIELPLNSDTNATNMLALVMAVLDKPACHPKLIGNSEVSLSEIEHLKSQWERRENLIAARHPVVLSEK